MHRPLQHIGARATEGERSDEQREHEERGIDAVEPKMHLLSGDKPNPEHRRDSESDRGERRAKADIHCPLKLIGERCVERRQAFGRQHQYGDEDAAERRRGSEMLDAEIDDDGEIGRERDDAQA